MTGIFLTSVSFTVFTIFRQQFHFQLHATSGPENNILNQKWITRAGRAQVQIACENIRFSSLFTAEDVFFFEEKRMFSQAKVQPFKLFPLY